MPAPVMLKRLGREAVLDKGVRGSIGEWYAEAIATRRRAGRRAGVRPRRAARGRAVDFSIEIGVRPDATLGNTRARGRGCRARHVRRGDRCGGGAAARALGRLETVERAAGEGDFVVVDYAGSVEGEAFAGGEGRDQMIELGSGRLIPGFEEQLTGASAGDERTVKITFPDDYGAEELAGQEAEFAVTVKEVKAKDLPAVVVELGQALALDLLDRDGELGGLGPRGARRRSRRGRSG